MAQQVPKPKWEAKVSRTVENASADQIWPLYEDFFGIDRYFPGLSKCYGVHGSNGEVGSILYCESLPILTQGDSKENSETAPVAIIWSKEKLIAIDPAEKSLSYKVVDGNTGFHSYVAKVKIIQGGDDDNDDQGGCVVEWSFSVDPVVGI